MATNYREMLANELMNRQNNPDPVQQQYENELMRDQGRDISATVGLIDSLSGGNARSSLPKQESMKDRLGQLLQLRNGQQDQKIKGLTSLAQMQYQDDDRDWDRKYKMAMLNLRQKKNGPGGKALSATDIAKHNEGNQIPAMLNDVSTVIQSNKDMFGPMSGRLAGMNPYNEKAQTMDSQIRASSQAFGRYMEGGVLRKEDEEKYRKMFPNLSDTPEVAANKLAVVNRLLSQKQQSTVDALRMGGYDVSAIDRNLAVPELPSVINGGSRAPGNQGLKGANIDDLSDEEVMAMYAQMKGAK